MTIDPDTEEQKYIVDWDTRAVDLDLSRNYRIHVDVSGAELGYADVDVVGDGGELKSVDTGERIGLMDGRTLPIAFRIENGGVHVVTVAGGVVSAQDGRVALEIPEGAVNEPTGIIVELAMDYPEDPGLVPGTVFEFGPDGLTFQVPIHLTLSYGDDPLPEGVDESSLRVHKDMDGVWVPLPEGAVDVGAKKASASIESFSRYAVVEQRAKYVIAAGTYHSCAARVGGEAYCWGDNRWAQMGDGTLVSKASPVPVRGTRTFKDLAAKQYHTCGVTTLGEVYCWGQNYYGQLGLGTSNDGRHAVPEKVVGDLVFGSVGNGWGHTCGVSIDQSTHCWGRNEVGTLGIGSYSLLESTPVAVIGGNQSIGVYAGWVHTCVLKRSGEAQCWGERGWGQLGNTEADQYQSTPVTVGDGQRFTSMAAGGSWTCGIDKFGTVYCWGRGSSGTLGIGEVPSSYGTSSPTPVKGGLTFKSIAAGTDHTCALTPGGLAYCWGLDNYGQAGGGVRTYWPPVWEPTAVVSDLAFATISAGGSHTCAVTETGDVYCWGRNYEGQIGIGTTSAAEPTPRFVFTLEDAGAE